MDAYSERNSQRVPDSDSAVFRDRLPRPSDPAFRTGNPSRSPSKDLRSSLSVMESLQSDSQQTEGELVRSDRPNLFRPWISCIPEARRETDDDRFANPHSVRQLGRRQERSFAEAAEDVLRHMQRLAREACP